MFFFNFKMINKFCFIFLIFNLINYVYLKDFKPIHLKDIKILEFRSRIKTIGYSPKPQLTCVRERELCNSYSVNLVKCKTKEDESDSTTKAPELDYLDIERWECNSIMSSMVDFDEKEIDCETYIDKKNNNKTLPQIVIEGSCFLRYSLKRSTKLTEWDNYLFVKAACYFFFSLIFLSVCCIMAHKNKRAQANRAEFVNVYCVTNGDNETLVFRNSNFRSTNNNNDEIDDLPPSYNSLFN